MKTMNVPEFWPQRTEWSIRIWREFVLVHEKKVRAGTPKKVKVQTKEPLSDWMCMAYGPKIVKLFTFEIIYVVSST